MQQPIVVHSRVMSPYTNMPPCQRILAFGPAHVPSGTAVVNREIYWWQDIDSRPLSCHFGASSPNQ